MHYGHGTHETVGGQDPTVDRQDGARSIEITAMFDTSVLAVRHLENPRAGRVAGATWGLLAIAAGTILAGVAYTFGGQGGFGGLMLALGMGTGVFGLLRMLDERRSPHFVIGEADESDLPVVHSALPAGAFPLVRSTGSDYELLLTSAMEGDISVGADRYDVATLISSGRAHRDGAVLGAFALPLPTNGRAYLRFGDHAFLIASVPAARRVVTPLLGSLRWSTQVFTGLSFVAHAALLAIVFAAPPDAKALNLDAFSTNNKFVNYAIKPKQEDDSLMKWMQMQKLTAEQSGAKGKRHIGKEGRAGNKTAPKVRRRYAIKGTAKEAELSKTLAARTAATAGVLGILNQRGGSPLASLFGKEHALGDKTIDAMGGILADQLGEGYGLGGMGVIGIGRGGGNINDGYGTVGLGRIGTHGHGDGTDGRYGGNVGRLRRRVSKGPKIGIGRIRMKGALDKELIRRTVRRHLNEVKFCYQRELQRNPKLGGRIVVQFTIGGKGTVLLSKVQSSTLDNATVESCVASAVRRWSFPAPQGGGLVMVSYPFRLHSTSY